jgi:hypothetical protein
MNSIHPWILRSIYGALEVIWKRETREVLFTDGWRCFHYPLDKEGFQLFLYLSCSPESSTDNQEAIEGPRQTSNIPVTNCQPMSSSSDFSFPSRKMKEPSNSNCQFPAILHQNISPFPTSKLSKLPFTICLSFLVEYSPNVLRPKLLNKFNDFHLCFLLSASQFSTTIIFLQIPLANFNICI